MAKSNKAAEERAKEAAEQEKELSDLVAEIAEGLAFATSAKDHVKYLESVIADKDLAIANIVSASNAFQQTYDSLVSVQEEIIRSSKRIIEMQECVIKLQESFIEKPKSRSWFGRWFGGGLVCPERPKLAGIELLGA